MRRTVAVVCIALGVFGLVLAPLLRFYVAPSLMEAPLDQYTETVNRAENASYFSAEEVELIEGATLEAYTTVRGDVAASDGDTAVWDQFTWVEDVDSGFALQSTTRRAAFDRYTGMAVNCCDESLNEESVNQEGIAFKFPFLTEKKTYPFYDTTLKKAIPIEFQGVEKVNGVTAYKFQQVIEPTKSGTRTLPASLLGLDQEGDVEADVMYSNTRTYWVEPTTGAPIDLNEDRRIVAQADGGELVLFEGNMQFTEETIEGNISAAQQGITFLPLLRTTLPLTLVVVGIGLAALGTLLYVSGRAQGMRRA